MWLLLSIILIVFCVKFFIKALPYVLIGIALAYAFIYWWISLIIIALLMAYFINRAKKQ